MFCFCFGFLLPSRWMVIEISCRYYKPCFRVQIWKEAQYGNLRTTGKLQLAFHGASKWAHKRFSICTPPRAVIQARKWVREQRWKTSTFHGFVGNCLKASLRGPSRRDHIMVLWILKLWSWKTWKEKWKTTSTGRTGLPHSIIIISGLENFTWKKSEWLKNHLESDLCVRCVKNGNYCCSIAEIMIQKTMSDVDEETESFPLTVEGTATKFPTVKKKSVKQHECSPVHPKKIYWTI